MGKDNKVRSSNIELLRIVAMLMIIGAHYVVIGLMHTSYGEPYTIWAEGNSVNRLFTSFFAAGGDTGVGVFFLITGFFISESSKRRSLKGIVCPIVFYAFIGSILHILFSLLFSSGISKTNMLKLLICPITGNNWWFATSYIVLVLLSPVLNVYIHNVSNKRLIFTIFIIWLFWYCAGYGLQLNFWGIERGVFFYFIGAFFRKNFKRYNKAYRWMFLLLFIVSWMLYWLTTYLIASSIGGLNVPDILNRVIITDTMKMTRAVVFAPICSITLFGMFLTINIKDCKPINTIAAMTFGVYLLHEVPINRELMWSRIFKCEYVYKNTSCICLIWLPTVICIFIVGLLFEMIRKRVLEEKMNSLYTWLFKREKVNDKDEQS